MLLAELRQLGGRLALCTLLLVQLEQLLLSACQDGLDLHSVCLVSKASRHKHIDWLDSLMLPRPAGRAHEPTSNTERRQHAPARPPSAWQRSGR